MFGIVVQMSHLRAIFQIANNIAAVEILAGISDTRFNLNPRCASYSKQSHGGLHVSVIFFCMFHGK